MTRSRRAWSWCSRALSKAIDAWCATLESSRRSSSVNFFVRSCVSSWITPNAALPGTATGAIITERILKSVIDCDIENLLSVEASSTRNASMPSRHLRTMVPLKRGVSSVCRRLRKFRTSILPVMSSLRMMKQRSDCLNKLNKVSMIRSSSAVCSVAAARGSR